MPELKPGDEGYVEPKKDPPEGLKQEPEGLKKAPEGLKKEPGDPLAHKLEGEGVPDKYKGKTVKEVMEMTGITETELTKAQTEIKQWHKFGEEMEATQAAAEKKAEYNPLEHVDEDTAKAVTVMVAEQMKPITGAMDAFMLERVEQTRPDFGEVKERALKVFRDMPQAHKYHPKYGLDFAYRFAKAEKEGGPPPPGPKPSEMGPSNTGGEETAKEGALTKGELYVAEKMGMSPEGYKKYKTEQSPTVEVEERAKQKEQ